MDNYRTVISSFTARPVKEGAGVSLYRVFGNMRDNITDPFLLLDNFGSDNPDDYTAGFPWHPHRGIETVTYMLEGEVEHEDSLGNKGRIRSGDVQWMTAGSGIIHQEMPQNTGVHLRGFQLWVNLPKKSKMMNPRYRDVNSKEIPVYKESGLNVKIICGEYGGMKGPVKDLEVDVEYMDFELGGNKEIEIKTNPAYNALVYVFEGSGNFSENEEGLYNKGQLLLFSKGDGIRIKAGGDGVRFLYIAGMPLGEPVAWYGPIVMNTREEIETAFREISDGTFLKKH